MTTTTPDTTEVVTLKPCPFCDAGAHLVNHSLEGTVGVRCDRCPAELLYVGETVQEAATAWNTRPTDSAGVPDGLVERLRKESRQDHVTARCDLLDEAADTLARLAALSARPSPPKVDATGVEEDHGDGAVDVHRWINTAYGCHPRDVSSRFSRFNMVTAYHAGEKAASPTRGAEDTQAEDWTGGRAWPDQIDVIAQYWAEWEEDRAGRGTYTAEELAEDAGNFATGLADHLAALQREGSTS